MARRTPARPVVEKLRGLPNRISLVWLLPILAVLFAAYMLWQSYEERGPQVEIIFDGADGVEAGSTRIRHKDVDVGTVEEVRFGDDLETVVVVARLDPDVAPYIDADTRFWIVNARINTTEISGLSTLLSGAYIEVDWDSTPGDRQRTFEGLQEAPLTQRGTPGMRVTLNADEAGYIYVGSPVFFRQIEVGRVERRRLQDDGQQVLFDLFVEAPYHKHIYQNTRFFGVSGVEANLTADGASVRVESIAALFTGGIAFVNNNLLEAEEPIMRDGTNFKLYDNRLAALDSFFDDDDDDRYRYMVEFSGTIKGLRAGAAIEYNGLRVGRVLNVSLGEAAEGESVGDPTKARAVLQFQPRRLGVKKISKEAFNQTLQSYVNRGIRVQLASGNILTGSLMVKLVEMPDEPAYEVDFTQQPYPMLPTTQSNISAVTADVETLIKNLSELPLSSLVTAATDLISDTRTLVASSDTQALPAQITETLASFSTAAKQLERASGDLPVMMKALTSASRNADDVLSGLSPDSELYVELAAAVRELRVAAKSIAAFAELLEENPNAVLTGR
ncbi:MAG: MlaD family protein [Granulosicoccaceae bacterium]